MAGERSRSVGRSLRSAQTRRRSRECWERGDVGRMRSDKEGYKTKSPPSTDRRNRSQYSAVNKVRAWESSCQFASQVDMSGQRGSGGGRRIYQCFTGAGWSASGHSACWISRANRLGYQSCSEILFEEALTWPGQHCRYTNSP